MNARDVLQFAPLFPMTWFLPLRLEVAATLKVSASLPFFLFFFESVVV